MRSLIAIQEGQLPLEILKKLEDLLQSTYAKHIGPDPLTIIWNLTAKKHGITNRQWSRSSAVSVEVPDGLAKDTREAFLTELDRKWRVITGQHPDHLSIAAFDSGRFSEITKGNLARLSTFGRILFMTKMMFRLSASKRRFGIFMTDFNQ